MSEFSDRPLVAGSITGLRSFSLDTLGRLTGVHYAEVFRPGENTAQCRKSDGRVTIRVGGTSATFPFWSMATSTTNEPSPEEEAHRVAQLDCGCGYYAYFDKADNPHHKPGNVLGIVEGYGAVTVGTRGFRAEKARLVALVEEQQRFARLRSAFLSGAWWFAWAILDVVLMVADLLGHHWFTALFVGLCAATCVATGVFCRRSARKQQPGRGSRIPAVTRRNYPDVPVYPTLPAALAAHPLTPPPAPTPETDEDFWTRSAR